MLTKKLLGTTLIAGLMGSIAHAELPAPGAMSEAVVTEYGEPSDKTLPIGQPAITRWIYDTFTVVFEEDRVIHAFPRSTNVENRPLSDIPERPTFVEYIDQTLNKPGAEANTGLIMRANTGEQAQEEMDTANEAAAAIDAPETPAAQ